MVTDWKRFSPSLPLTGKVARLAVTDEVIQTQRTSHKQTIQQNFTVDGRTTTQNRRGDSRIARQTNGLNETNGRPQVSPTM